MKKEKHVGSQVKRRTFPALVAVLILVLLAVGTWTTVGVAGDGTPAPGISGTGQTGGKNSTSDNGDLPAARPHPRGLPRAVRVRTGTTPKRTVSRARLSPRRSVARRCRRSI